MLGALWYGFAERRRREFGLLHASGDWRGIALMAVGLATFQTVLDDGNDTFDWFRLALHRQIEPRRGGLTRRLRRARILPTRTAGQFSGCSDAGISASAPWEIFLFGFALYAVA